MPRFRFDTVPTGLPIVRNALAPGFATHSAEYTYFFGFPPEYDMLNMNPSVVNISSHLNLSRGIVAGLSSFITSSNPNTYKGIPAHSKSETMAYTRQYHTSLNGQPTYLISLKIWSLMRQRRTTSSMCISSRTLGAR